MDKNKKLTEIENKKGQWEKTHTAIVEAEEWESYGLSSAQRRLYFIQQFYLDSTSYNMPEVIVIAGKLELERVREAFRRLIERHDSLRTLFKVEGNEIVQKVRREVDFEIEYREELSDEQLTEEEMEELVNGFIRPFNLSEAPLLRARLVKVQPQSYILMYDIHHIISDGMSVKIFTEELIRLYEGKELPELKLQYKDYAVWQNSRMKSQTIKMQEEYWMKTFLGGLPVLNLPIDYARPSMQNFEGESIFFELDEELTEGLRKIVKETGTTMYMVLLAGINILLSKYSGQEDIVVGSLVAGRHYPDLENIVGVFENTLAFRNYPEGNKSFRAFLEEVKANVLGAYENQDFQFGELVERLGIQRDMSRNPLFDVMFTFQNMGIKECTIEGLRLKRYERRHVMSKFDLTIGAVETEGKIAASIEYRSKLYNKETIKRMKGHLIKILGNITKDVDKRLDEITILTEEEKYKLLHEFNNTYADYPRDKSVHELFEEQVKKTPDNIAVVYEEKALTYRELNEKSNQLARALREKGVEEDCIVGIMVERSLEMIVGIMGILKSGGAYLPIDPEYPKDRIDYMLEDSRASILLTQKKLCTNVENSSTDIVDIEETIATSTKSTENLNIRFNSKRAFYLIYTSGSTGNPKGAVVKSDSFTNLLNWFVNEFEINERDKILLIAPIAFDLAQKNLYASLIKGGRLCILAARTYNYIKVLQAMEKERITIINCTPSAFQPVLDTAANYYELRHLRVVFLGGEPTSLSKLICWMKSPYYRAEIVNMYGPTECTSIATFYRIPNEHCESIKVIPIGKPINNVKVYIVGNRNNMQPIGIAGELCIAGDGVARGYLNKPELTEEKFVDNPFEPGEKMYRTGDLVRWLPDGNIEFLGRTDHQVKIRGYRIELGEIESRLLSHGQIKEAVVTAKEDENGDKYLCAYIVGTCIFTLSELKDYLSEELPAHMIPSYFIQLDKIPLTPNGKIDRGSLPKPDRNMATGTEYEAPRDEIEEKLVEIWKEVLKVKKLGIKDNFFGLGGHSLKATSLVAKIHKELNVEISVVEIFRAPTIKGLSEYIKGWVKKKHYSN